MLEGDRNRVSFEPIPYGTLHDFLPLTFSVSTLITYMVLACALARCLISTPTLAPKPTNLSSIHRGNRRR